MVELISYVDPVISEKWSEEQSVSRDFCAGLVLKRLLTHAIARMRSVTDAHAHSYGYCVDIPLSPSIRANIRGLWEKAGLCLLGSSRALLCRVTFKSLAASSPDQPR